MNATDGLYSPFCLHTTIEDEPLFRKSPVWLRLPPTSMISFLSSLSKSAFNLQISRNVGMYSPTEGVLW